MWSTAGRLEEALEALREIESLADSAGDPEELLDRILALAREVLY